MTYAYLESTAVLGPLATQAEPHGYDLCSPHAHALSVPRGWEVIRLAVDHNPQPSTDDLLALADAVREIGFGYDGPTVDRAGSAGASRGSPSDRRPSIVEIGRRGHLTVLADPDA